MHLFRHLYSETKRHPVGCLFSFPMGDMNRMTSGGGSGLGARARPVDGEASATREKTRSIGYEPCRVPETTMFLTGPTNPTPATKPSLGIIRILRLFSSFLHSDVVGSIGCKSPLTIEISSAKCRRKRFWCLLFPLCRRLIPSARRQERPGNRLQKGTHPQMSSFCFAPYTI